MFFSRHYYKLSTKRLPISYTFTFFVNKSCNQLNKIIFCFTKSKRCLKRATKENVSWLFNSLVKYWLNNYERWQPELRRFKDITKTSSKLINYVCHPIIIKRQMSIVKLWRIGPNSMFILEAIFKPLIPKSSRSLIMITINHVPTNHYF